MARRNKTRSNNNNYNSNNTDVVVKARKGNGLLMALLGGAVAFIGVAEVYKTHSVTDKSIVRKSPAFTRILYGESKIVRARFVPEDYRKSDSKNRANKSLFKNFFSKNDSDEMSSKEEGGSILDFLKRKPRK